MKVKVVSFKSTAKITTKTVILVIIAIILNRLAYFGSNVHISDKLKDKKFSKLLNSEIPIMWFVSKDENKREYSKETIQSEINLFKLANLNGTSTIILKDEEKPNMSGEKEQIEIENPGEAVETNTSPEENLNQKNDISEPAIGQTIEILPSNVPDKTTYQLFGVNVRCECDYNLPNEIKDLDVEFNKQKIAIFHTHTCESYTPTQQFQYTATGAFRTTDLNYTVSRVGDELEKLLTNYGYNVVHDKTYHDYPSYTGSYDRSLKTVKGLLQTNDDVDIVIDLHRDAIGDNTYAPTVKIGDEYCARLMFVIGTDGGGLSHKEWRENLKIALKIQAKANELYPGLFKPMIVRNSRYNQHLAKGACIIEVGSTGNTLEQCINSMKYLAKIYNEL